jgi:hypothetical protein
VCPGDIPLLAVFVTTAQHDDEKRFQHQSVHAPAGTEMFAHFEYAGSHPFDVPKIALCGFPQPGYEAYSGFHVTDTAQPLVELGQAFDSVH